MELRRCGNLHFINAIKGNLVTKLRNVDSCGKPSLIFKTLENILKHEDVKRLQPSTSHSLQFPVSEFYPERGKSESLYVPLVDRRLREIDPKGNEYARHCAYDKTGSDSDDYIFGKMTLKQFKEKCKTKKRKYANSIGLNPKEVEIKLEQEEDESDLKTPLSSLKLKLPKAKRKHRRAGSKSPKVGISSKSKKNLDSGMQHPSNLLLLVNVKEEIPEPEFTECEKRISFLDDSHSNYNSDESSDAKSISVRNLEMVEYQKRKRMLFPEEYGSCTLNGVSYDHLEDIVPISVLLPSCQETMEANQQRSCQQFLDFPLSEFETEENIEQPLPINLPTKDQSSDFNDCSRSFRHTNEFQSTAMRICDLTVGDSSSSKDLNDVSNSCWIENDVKKNLASYKQIREISSPARLCNSSWNPDPRSSTDDNDDLLSLKDGLTGQKPTSICSSANGPNNYLNSGNHFGSLEDESALNEEEQPPRAISIGQGRNFSLEDQNCNANESPSTSLLGQPPERLLSTRKIISPTSQERLCLAMNATKLYNDRNNKGKLYLGKKIENKASSLGSDVKQVNVAEYPSVSCTANQRNVTISPTRILKKPKNDRRSSPPKGKLEGPRLSRSLPTVGSGCTSLRGCSESAIAFSQRQMHDIESLAMKLMSELKSMKDIVEEKLLFEAYRNVSLKNDADEVKILVTNATKVEETARKWLSMMARDCNRFCKIMSLTQKSATGAASNNVVQRERKKISFADEVGGALCQVKFFDDGMTSQESISVKQEDQTI